MGTLGNLIFSSLKWFANTSRFLVLSLIVFGGVGFLAAKAPSYYDAAIRGYVGSRTVKILGKNSGGTGFYVKAKSGKTYIMTNAHVCTLKDSKNEVYVERYGSKRRMSRRIIEMSQSHDLCLIESTDSIEGLDLARSLSVGEKVTIVGHPKLFPLVTSHSQYIGDTRVGVMTNLNARFAVSLSQYRSNKILKVAQSLGFRIKRYNASQIVGYSRGGNSGSAIVNFYGNVVAVLFAGNRRDSMETYAVPLAYVKEFLSEY